MKTFFISRLFQFNSTYAALGTLGVVVSLSACVSSSSIALPTTHTYKIEVHGHRGARARLPENTLPAFEYAMKAGADYLEMDMAVTSDDHIVISHEPTISPEICVGPDGKPDQTRPLIHSLTLAQVKSYDCGAVRNPKFPTQTPVPGTRIPTLDEVFQMVENSTDPHSKTVRFNIETKIYPNHPDYTVNPQKFIQLFFEVLQRHHVFNRIVLQSFDYRTLVEARRIKPDIVISALSESLFEDLVNTAVKLHANIISPYFKLVKPSLVVRLHQLGVRILPWTPDTPADWAKLIHMNVDGIITDDPKTLIDLLEQP